MSPILIQKILSAALIIHLQFISTNILSNEIDQKSLINLLNANPVEDYPRETIESKDGILFCSGNSEMAKTNNRAAGLILKENYNEAAQILVEGLKNAPLFFPFRYNLGICYLYMNELKGALLQFNKVKDIIPEYSKTYLRIGYIYQRWDLDSEAVIAFRDALKRNVKELSSYIEIGNIYYKRNQLEMAKKYYESSLKINHRYPDGLLGMAKILFKREKYIQAINSIKAINISGEYDKALHYYYGEAAFKLRDYKTASEEYAKLLKFSNDRFFMTNSKSLIEHKLNLSIRFNEK